MSTVVACPLCGPSPAGLVARSQRGLAQALEVGSLAAVDCDMVTFLHRLEHVAEWVEAHTALWDVFGRLAATAVKGAPAISLLIPTRNRPELARLCVEAALHAAGDECEIVVADNGDVPLKLPQGDPRLRHLPPEARVLSMPDNWERALLAARGEWTLLLADKYMLVPGALGALRHRLAAQPGLRVATYGYAVLRQGLSGADARDERALRAAGGELRWPANHGDAALAAAAAAFDALYARVAYPGRHPMLYTALVHREVIAEGLRRTGRYFVGPCPDVASAAQITSACERYLDTHVPLVMVQYPSEGAAWSTGTSVLVGGDVARDFFGRLPAAVGREPIERLVAGAILATLTAFARARPDLATRARVAWVEFAKQAAREIEAQPLVRRPRLHLSLLAYVLRRGHDPRAAYAQVRTALASHLPRGVLTHLLAWRRRVFASAPPPDVALPVASARVGSRDEALRLLSDLVARTP